MMNHAAGEAQCLIAQGRTSTSTVVVVVVVVVVVTVTLLISLQFLYNNLVQVNVACIK